MGHVQHHLIALFHMLCEAVETLDLLLFISAVGDDTKMASYSQTFRDESLQRL